MTPARSLAHSANPYLVPPAVNRLPLRVVGAVEELYEFFALLMNTVKRRGLPPNMLRVAGGCSGMSEDVRVQALDYLVEGLQGYRGLLSCGGTRTVEDGRIKLMITDILQLMVEHASHQVVTLGTLPRVDTMQLVENSRLVLDASGTAPQPGVHQLVIVQSHGTERHLQWDGDVIAYLEMMSRYALVSHMFGKRAQPVLVALEGGSVVRQEIVLAAARGFPVVLVYGYGRTTDAIVQDLVTGRPITCRVNGHEIVVPSEGRHLMRVVQAGDVSQLAAELAEICL